MKSIKEEKHGFYICRTRLADIHLRFRPSPHIHVRSGSGNFTITLKDRIVEGRAKSKVIQLINQFIDEHEAELFEIWDKAQRGEKIKKIKR